MNNEAEIASINHNVSSFVEQQKIHNERLKRRGWSKWTTVKRVRNLMLELLNASGDRDRYIHNFIDKYHYHGYVIVTELELSENSKPALVKELHDYCQKELTALKDVEKQKRKDVRRLKTINKRRIRRGLKPFKHLPVYNRTRDARNHARNIRRNLIAAKNEEQQMQVLNGQQKENIDRMIDEAFDLKHYILALPELGKKTPFDWSSLLQTHNH